jgi:hypothetical protein
MNDISYKLIKNGLHALVEEEETYFKKNIVQSLSIKLNNAIKDVYTESKKGLMLKEEKTKNTKELQTFLKILENKEKIRLKNDSIINIDENDISALKELFEHLNVENRQKMVESVFNSAASLRQHIEFYQKAKGLFK